MKKLIKFIKDVPKVYNLNAPNHLDDIEYSIPILFNDNADKLSNRSDYYGLSLSFSQSNSFLINDSGGIDGNNNDYYVHNFKLGYFLLSKSIEGEQNGLFYNDDKTAIIPNPIVNISGWDYVDTYIEGYKEGIDYFEKEYESIKQTKSTRHFTNALVNELQNLYLKQPKGEFDNVWSFKGGVTFPYILNHQTVKKHGRYNGLLNCFIKAVKQYPKSVYSFEKKFSSFICKL